MCTVVAKTSPPTSKRGFIISNSVVEVECVQRIDQDPRISMRALSMGPVSE